MSKEFENYWLHNDSITVTKIKVVNGYIKPITTKITPHKHVLEKTREAAKEMGDVL